MTALVVLTTWTLLLPRRILWTGFHLIRLRESRGAEFEADRLAVMAYSAPAFVNGLTAIRATTNTLRSIRALYARSGNYYATVREHYVALPAGVIGLLRMEAVRGYRTLESTHPILPDRVRAAYILNTPPPPLPAPPLPAQELLMPTGEADA